jgi:predicted negative regulator of RcsB-dependent stress response
MKTAERHRLKDNEIAEGLALAGEFWQENTKPISQALAVVAVVAILGVAYWWWQHSRLEAASALLADARATANAPVAPPPAPVVPGQPAPAQPPVPANAFATEAARNDAALKKFEATATAYPSTSAGLAARVQAASLLGELGKIPEAEKQYEETARLDPNGLYGRMARLGIATIQVDTGRLDPAIATLSELAQRTDLEVPVDGVLMQLGRAYEKAGKKPDAIRTFTRIGDEFPESPYAADARAELDRLKAAPAGA